MTTSPSLTTAPLPRSGQSGLGDRFAAHPQGAPWGWATRSTGEFSNGTSGENYSGINRVDQGTEFVSRDLDLWAYHRGATLDFSRPGKPTDNAFIEAFNGRFRAECLNAHWFLTLADAKEKLEDWRKYYNRASEHPSVYVVEEKRLC